MNKFERDQVDLIIENYWIAIDGIYNDIPWQGSSIAGQLVDFKGDLPPPSNFKVESISARAEKLARCSPSHFTYYSEKVFRKLGDFLPAVLLAPRFFQTKTKAALTQDEISSNLGMSVAEYRGHLIDAREAILMIDKSMRPEVYDA